MDFKEILINREVFVICMTTYDTVLGYKIFVQFTNEKPEFSEVTVVDFADQKKSFRGMIFLSQEHANEKRCQLAKREDMQNEVLYVAPLSTLVAGIKAWR